LIFWEEGVLGTVCHDFSKRGTVFFSDHTALDFFKKGSFKEGLPVFFEEIVNKICYYSSFYFILLKIYMGDV